MQACLINIIYLIKSQMSISSNSYICFVFATYSVSSSTSGSLEFCQREINLGDGLSLFTLTGQ